MYLVKTPFWLKTIYPSLTWNKSRKEKNIFLTFDDGPHEIATAFVLEELKKYNALATFFCIGKNVEKHLDIYNQILNEGHSVGNHTQNHVNGWNCKTNLYIENVVKASGNIHSNLFRPPYGRITQKQIKALKKEQYNIIMWDVLSGDFDSSISNEKCLQNVISNTENGSIIVFHDSEKAFSKLQFVLPKILEHFKNQGYVFSALK